jgi:transcriptional regulator with XRE-family HTH domain
LAPTTKAVFWLVVTYPISSIHVVSHRHNMDEPAVVSASGEAIGTGGGTTRLVPRIRRVGFRMAMPRLSVEADVVNPNSVKPSRRAELREFLVSRRARVSPAEAGLDSDGRRRRTPGLRREEVAVLSGVSPSWYQWLEQGRDISVSAHVLESVARVLKLNEAERRHLYLLAEMNPPLPLMTEAHGAPAALTRLMQAWAPNPAHVIDRYWNKVAYNEAARVAFGFDSGPLNCMVRFFTDDRYRTDLNESAGVAESLVSYYRGVAAGYPRDDGFRSVIDEVSTLSSAFDRLWATGDVAGDADLLKEFAHPDAGALRFEGSQLQIPGHPDLTLVLHTPKDADTKDRLNMLML